MTLAFGALPTPQQFQAMILMAGLNLLGIIGEMSIGMMESVVLLGTIGGLKKTFKVKNTNTWCACGCQCFWV